jgi:hypothetical protein
MCICEPACETKLPNHSRLKSREQNGASGGVRCFFSGERVVSGVRVDGMKRYTFLQMRRISYHVAMVLPLIHVVWQARMMAQRARLIEHAKANPVTI